MSVDPSPPARVGKKLDADPPPWGSDPIWHPYTALPVAGPRALLTRAEGAFVYDEGGKGYFDATSSWWCNTHGHCHPRLVAALARQAGTLDHVMIAPHAHPTALSLAGELLKVLGAPFEKIFYSDDGSTAVEAAMKMAVQYWHNRGRPRRRRFVAMDRAYHGDTLGALSVSHVSEFHHFFDSIKMPVERTAAPYCYRCPLGEVFPHCKTRCLDPGLESIDRHRDEIAAVIIEPLVLGAGGMICYPKDYLERLISFCRDREILVIFDEVFTGFGRTGTFFAFEQLSHPGLRPDIVCLSKGLTAGMLPMGVTAVSGGVFDAFTGGRDRAFYHGHTFTGNALAAAIGLESLRIFQEEKVIERNRALIRIFEEATPRFRALSHVGDVRHLGMIWALELVIDRAQKGIFHPPNGPGWKIANALWHEGYWLRPLHNLLYVVPPYCTSESDLRRLLSVLYSHLQIEAHFKE